MTLIDRAGDEMTVAPLWVCSPFVATNELGRRLRAHREAQPGGGPRGRMTADEAAAMFGVHQSTYTRWEQGGFFPEGPKAVAVARWLGMPVEDLYRLRSPETGEPVTTAEVIVRLRELEQNRREDLAKIEALEDAVGQIARRLGDEIERLVRLVSEERRAN